MSWMKMASARQGLDRSKARMQILRKPFFHFVLCFFVGFGIGLTPLSSGGGGAREQQRPRESFTAAKRIATEEQVVVLDSSSPLEISANSSRHPGEGRMPLQDPKKLLIIVTPTYTRPFQAMYLTRLAHTLKLVDPPLLWIVVEMPGQSLETASLLRKTGVMYRHLACEKNLTNVKDRGTQQRNLALQHIERHQLDGIVYFADDDNFYSLELFDQLREIKRFGTWPVAMLAHSKSKTILEGPVCDGHKVTGWHTNEKSKRLRRFHVDMSGFGFNSTILWDPRRWKRPTTQPVRQLDTVKEGFQETTFIEQLVEDENQMEGLPSGCSKIMVWHLHLESQIASYPSNWKMDKFLEPVIHL
ncbi:glycosyltransferase IRX9-like protein [Selaginella moellendorffii]|uniref:Glycosyltransferases n=1 Tax=Selaginella moellendorffii TaxID=88036 RepID=D8QW45_SELML|nr:probable beta-1,4-xylosyltransferase IRX9H [Selaginella moellendorffii]ANR94920.1 GT43A [Selaginella moellendorffii]EFJ36570.1 glycosyltransferase IRX9-like protein [Selaginella moellendorffii]|eukprot:XP_002963107.1 probable beta-1,4-xylosyltransferase IRX9H [Selaginella moellendorffii]